MDSWYTTPAAPAEEKAIAFRVAEGIRWTEIGINSINRIMQGAVVIIFGVAIAKGVLLSRWIGGFGIFAGAAKIYAPKASNYQCTNSSKLNESYNVASFSSF